MNAKIIEKNELYYYGLVNPKRESMEVIEYSNSLVPQMYDHNFFYMKAPLWASELPAFMKGQAAEQGFLKLFGRIMPTKKQAEWSAPAFEGYDYAEEELVYLSLADYQALNQAQTEVAYRKVETEQDLQLYCDFSFNDAKRISLSFAEEKNKLIRWLYQLPPAAFYIAVSEGKVVGSIDVYELLDYYKIENVYVDEAYRKRGIAGTLIKAAVQERKKKALGVGLTTHVEGMAGSLYKKLGFVEKAFSVNHLFTKPMENSKD
ncbi:GNAT family N-acetyltransferase [uncultured Enterococcus sp.]|uniref:GNAT family N-acetyltransferase n=1 Tax=uncultured Enterococcus sp. TaxID=167972 RepID=UPI002AA89182|nr:GNAT family N-acetyltransferase [uncultured Enterococcus sp.]